MIEKARSIVLLLGRVAVGVVFIAHGWSKFADMGISGTTAFFSSIGVPAPGIAAPVVATLELAGGAALVLGVALPVAGTLLALDMIGAIVFVHAPNGLFVDKGGYELVLTLAAASLAIGFTGGGTLAVDNLWRARQTAEVS